MKGSEFMAKQFSDFTFLDKSLSDMKCKYISVDFDKSDEIDLGAERDMVMGETNRYKNGGKNERRIS